MIIGCFTNALGLILMKYDIELKRSDEQQKSCLKDRKFFIFGCIFLLMSLSANIVSVNFGNLILISSSCAFMISFTLLLSRIILKEMWTVLDLISLVFIIIGTTGCMLNTKSSSENLKGSDVYTYFGSWMSLVLYLVSIVFFIGAHYAYTKMLKSVTSGWQSIC